MVVVAAGAFDVEGLRDGRKAEELVLFEVFAEEVCFVPIETVLAVTSFTPTAVNDSKVSMAFKETDANIKKTSLRSTMGYRDTIASQKVKSSQLQGQDQKPRLMTRKAKVFGS